MAAHSDAFVFFGATGDLAYKKIFPALQNMVRQGTLNVPVIGVAKSGWTVEQLRERARDSITKHGGGVDDESFQQSLRAAGLRRRRLQGRQDLPDAARQAGRRKRHSCRRITWRFRPACFPWW